MELSVDAKFEHGLALIRQGLAILEKSSKGEPVRMVMSPGWRSWAGSPISAWKLRDGGGHMTLGRSRRSAGASGPGGSVHREPVRAKDSGASVSQEPPDSGPDTDPIR
jgi:hypothetical protein